MNRFSKGLMAAVLSGLLLSGCTGSSNSQSVSTDGSTSMEEVIGVLGEAFENENDNISFTYNPTGSGSGIQAVEEGRCDIGLSSRALTDDELAQGLEGTTIAQDGIAVILNPANPLDDLDLETLKKIYTGEITNWKELGGEDTEIVLIGREAGSGTRDGFESITDTEDQCSYRQELTSTGDVITTIAQNPDAIGYASLAAVGDEVKTISINGVRPSEASVKDGAYVISRPFVLVTNSEKTLSEPARKFFDFATSSSASDLISSAGAVPVH